jgi:hypothetical protein
MAHQPNPNDPNPNSFTVPTFRPPRNQELDLSKLTLEEFKSLQRKDAFMYYSLPGVLRASYAGSPINHSELMASMNGDAAAGPLAPGPLAPGNENARVVTRKTRISHECDYITALALAFEAMENNLNH